MTPPTADAAIPTAAVTRQQRSEMIRLAHRGEQHPDAAVAAAAYEWSHSPRWDRLSNRLPGWLLPAAGIVVIGAAIILAMPAIFIVGGAVVVILGCLGWISTSSARRVRAVYDQPVPAIASSAGDGADEG